MRLLSTSQAVSHKPHRVHLQVSPQLKSSASAKPTDEARYRRESRYLSGLVVLMLAALVLPAISLLLYIMLNPDAFQHPLIP